MEEPQLQPEAEVEAVEAAPAWPSSSWPRFSLDESTKDAAGMASALGALRHQCSDLWVEDTELRTIKTVGEGQFALVKRAEWRVPLPRQRQFVPTPALATATSDGLSRNSVSSYSSALGGEPTPFTTSSDGAMLMQVAVKWLKPHCWQRPRDVADFVEEARILSKIRHRNIVKLLGIGLKKMATGTLQVFVVMEYCNRGSLRTLLLKQMSSPHKSVYSLAEGLHMCKDITRALRYLHRATPMVLHRDLKLDNVLLSGPSLAEAEVKLSDFGLVALLPPTAAGVDDGSQHSGGMGKAISEFPLIDPDLLLESAAAILVQGDETRKYRAFQLTGKTGSLTCMAPEVTLMQPYSEKVDVFSLGVVIYEMLCKRLLAATATITGAPGELEMYAMRVAQGHREVMPSYWPPELTDIVGQCWSPEPSDRPTVHKVYEVLDKLEQSGKLEVLDRRFGSAGACCSVM